MNFKESIIKYKPVNDQEKNDKLIILEYIDRFYNNILTRQNELVHMTSSALILNSSLDKVLMIHHKIYNTWTWTGGHADGDSDMLEVALKEAKEETGVINIKPYITDIASLDILPVYGHYKKTNYVSAHLHLNTAYILIANENDKLIVNEEETSGLKWIDLDKVNEYSKEPYFIDIYNKLLKIV